MSFLVHKVPMMLLGAMLSLGGDEYSVHGAIQVQIIIPVKCFATIDEINTSSMEYASSDAS
jgi:hypothetical protein